jgi:glyoxylase-like metal-dependent hydrolase (beta-lactamase superfamily II)
MRTIAAEKVPRWVRGALIVIAVAAVAALLSGASRYPEKRKNTFMHISRLVVGPLQVNCYVVSDENTKEAVVIDPGDDAQDILQLVGSKGLKVRYIVNTHAHFDHVGANKQVKDATGAELLIHEADSALLSGTAGQARMFGMTAPSSPKADRYVKHGDVVTVGAVKLTVLHTPGHSAGGICLRGDGVVFSGDALFAGSIGRTDLMGGDLMTLIASIKTNLMTLPDETVVLSGHGPQSTIGEERRENPFLNSESGF